MRVLAAVLLMVIVGVASADLIPDKGGAKCAGVDSPLCKIS